MTQKKTRIVLPIAFRPSYIGAGHAERFPSTQQRHSGFVQRMPQLGQPPDCFSIDTPITVFTDSRPTAPNPNSPLPEPRL